MSPWEMAVFLAKVTAKRRGETVPAYYYNPDTGMHSSCTSTAYPNSPAMHSLFPDVAWNDAGCMFIHYVYCLGITAGCGNGYFCPALNVPREQMAAFLYNAEGQ